MQNKKVLSLVWKACSFLFPCVRPDWAALRATLFQWHCPYQNVLRLLCCIDESHSVHCKLRGLTRGKQGGDGAWSPSQKDEGIASITTAVLWKDSFARVQRMRSGWGEGGQGGQLGGQEFWRPKEMPQKSKERNKVICRQVTVRTPSAVN